MKILLLGTLVLSTSAVDIQDLGVLTFNRALLITNNIPKDFAHYKAELIAFPSSNKLTLHLTNGLIKITNFSKMPSGRIIMGLTTVTLDGEQSDTKVYRFELRKVKPEIPNITVVHMLDNENYEWLSKMPKLEVVPPIPGGMMRTYDATRRRNE